MNDFADKFRNRTKQFALDNIKLFQSLPKTEEARILGRQLLRSSTSVGSNYRAVCRARSDKEFFAKLSICVEEADECVFWLELLSESGISSNELTKALTKESIEIIAILSKSRKSFKENRNNK
ncbi:MAG: four helix bundle protein [Flavobacteriales bacterium]|nr:four helix bundle protein [Flavobacteriales bacterium]MBX2958671.1 four helix bundle protein [Flavobacteriales bacterium]MCL4856266.1 four helix bundle protein [Flavobacteriales bacterium]HRN41745.1 four helix bundle protein [Vicingus sp.]HRP59070.1 four helix bundle protein [Vicingus sp.]